MDITAQEKLMYDVMMSIYDSGIPIDFKGSMVLKACLLEAGYTEETRHTVDIDGNWCSDVPPTGERMAKSLETALRKNGIGLDVRIFRMYGEGRSAGFDLTDSTTGEIIFTMDIDVNRQLAPARMYEIGGVHFRGVSPIQMIADKVLVVSTNQVFRRIKDVMDLYYFAKVFDFNKSEILQVLKEGKRTLGKFDEFLNHLEELKHSYEKFRFEGDVNKPPFEEVYQTVKRYIGEILPK